MITDQAKQAVQRHRAIVQDMGLKPTKIIPKIDKPKLSYGKPKNEYQRGGESIGDYLVRVRSAKSD